MVLTRTDALSGRLKVGALRWSYKNFIT